MRITRAFFAPLLTAAACSGSAESLQFQALVAADVDSITAAYEARFFDDRRCDDLVTVAGRPDATRTATAALVRSADAPDGFEPVDLSFFSGTLALEVRALASDGVPLARRCVPVDSAVESTVAELASFAPVNAIVTILEDTALLSGTASQPIQIKVTDAQGRDVQNVLISSGPERALVATDAMGIARVRTPTDTPSFDGELTLEIYGVPGKKQAFATALTKPDCPAALFTRVLVPNVRGAPCELATQDLYAFVVRQRSSTVATALLEVLAIETQTAGLRTIVTATAGAVGPIAVTSEGDNYVVAIASSDRSVDLYRFVPATPALALIRRLTIDPRLGAQPLIRRVIFADGALLVIGEGLPSGGWLYPTINGAPTRAFEDDRDLLDLYAATLGDRDDLQLIAAGANGVELFSFEGDTLGAPSESVADLSGRFARGDPIDRVFVPFFSGDRLGTLRAGGDRIFAIGESRAPETIDSAAISDSFNDDDHEDVIAGGRSGVHLFAGNGRGRFLAAAACPLDSGVAALDPIGSQRWLAYFRQTGEIAVVGYDP